MKKILFSALFVMSAFVANAQRFVYVDVTSLLESIPDYKSAQTELDRLAEQWKQDIARQRQAVADLYNKYQAEKPLLSDAAQKQRQDDITAKEKQMMDDQKAKFSPEGELAKRRQSLVKPVQDRVYKAIQDYAKEKGYDFILDKGSAGMLYASDTFDKTKEVQERLGKQ